MSFYICTYIYPIVILYLYLYLSYCPSISVPTSILLSFYICTYIYPIVHLYPYPPMVSLDWLQGKRGGGGGVPADGFGFLHAVLAPMVGHWAMAANRGADTNYSVSLL